MDIDHEHDWRPLATSDGVKDICVCGAEYKAGDRILIGRESTMWHEVIGQVLVVDRVDEEGHLWVVTDLVSPMKQLCFDPTLVSPAPEVLFDVVDEVRADLSVLDLMGDVLPLCSQYLQQGIRHLQRNVEMDCTKHEDDLEIGDCVQPDRYDGDTMARLINAIPDLVALIDALQAAVERAASEHCGCLGSVLDDVR